MASSFLSEEEEMRIVLQYKVEVKALPRNGKNLRLWIPYPWDNTAQKVLTSRIVSPLPWRLEKDEKYGNPILFVEGKPSEDTLTLVMNLEILRRLDRGHPNQWDWKDYLATSPSIPWNGLIEKIAREEAGALKAPSKKIRALYNYVYRTMTYSKEGEGWGRGDPIWACAKQRGNCTDFHSLFIAMARAQGIPARFEIGLPLSREGFGNIPGYHCWAQVYEPGRGWFPIDISESKKLGAPNAFFGRLPPNRILLSAGRDIRLNPPQQGQPLNFFFDPYAEMDGQKMESVQASYSFKRDFHL